MRRSSILLGAMLALFSWPAFAQMGKSEVSISVTANVQERVSGPGVTDTPSHSGGGLVNYRYLFSRWGAVEANYAYTHFTQYYTADAAPLSLAQPAGSGMNEASLAYQFPFGVSSESRMRPFLEVGAGGLFFSAPVGVNSAVVGSSQTRVAVLYGGGVSYRVYHFVGVQLGYRGLFYAAPNFGVAAYVTNARTHMAEPYFGLTFRL